MRVGLIGYGYWGPNLARVLSQSERMKFVACHDVSPANLQRAKRTHSQIRCVAAIDEFWPMVDAVVIATPISTHFQLVRQALHRGKHVMVEKPLADSWLHATELARISEEAGLVLMTGHTFIYSPPVVKIKELLDSGALGDLHYISLSRVNLGLFQKDVDVIWDLAVHDVSILLYWLDEMPSWGTSFGRACVQQDKNDVAFIWLQFPSGVVASIEISWLSPQKQRRTSITGSKRMVVYDDTDPNEKVKIYDRSVTLRPPQSFGEFQLSYRTGDMVAPHLMNREPLTIEVEHFAECVETGSKPKTDGTFGAQVVHILEQVTQCKANQEISLKPLLTMETRAA